MLSLMLIDRIASNDPRPCSLRPSFQWIARQL